MRINEILPLLRCPKCYDDLIFEESVLKCCSNHSIGTDENVWEFYPEFEPGINDWDASLREMTVSEALDQGKSAMSKKASKTRAESMINFIIENVPKDEIVVDMATGRGLLAERLLPTISEAILTDISTHVLVGTEKKLKNKGIQNFVLLQCSGTELPFKDSTVKTLTCYGPNNVTDTKKLLKECYRTLLPGGIFVFSVALFDKDSSSHAWMIKELGNDGIFRVISDWREFIQEVGFKVSKQAVLFEGKLEKIELDLLPREEGEWGQDLGLVLSK